MIEPVSNITIQIIPEDTSQLGHLMAFDEAFEVFVERNKVYNDLWREDGIEGLVAHCKHKILRIGATQRIDDAIDLVNYSLFLLRLAMEEEDNARKGEDDAS